MPSSGSDLRPSDDTTVLEEVAYLTWKCEVLRYPLEEIQAYEAEQKHEGPRTPTPPQVTPQATPYVPGTRVRIIVEPRPKCDTGVVQADQWDERGGCLVKHDDGPRYGWSWHEMVSIVQEQQAEQPET